MERTEGNAAWAGQVSTMIDGLSPDDAGQLLVQLADGYRKQADSTSPPIPISSSPAAVPIIHSPTRRSCGSFSFTPAAKPPSAVQTQQGAAYGSRAEQNASLPMVKTAVQQTSATDSYQRQRTARHRSHARRPPPPRRPTRRLSEDRSPRAVRRTQRSLRRNDRPAPTRLRQPGQRFYLTLRNLPEADPWRRCAATEEWLAQPADSRPRKKSPPVAPPSNRPTSTAIWTNPSGQSRPLAA